MTHFQAQTAWRHIYYYPNDERNTNRIRISRAKRKKDFYMAVKQRKVQKNIGNGANEKIDYNKNVYLKKWHDDDYVNALIKKVRSDAPDSAEARDELGMIFLTAGRSYAGKEIRSMASYAHAGNEVDDLAQEIAAAMWGAVVNMNLEEKENFKSYAVKVAMNAKTSFGNRESTTFSIFAKANAESKELFKQVLNGDNVETGNKGRDYALNVVAAQSDGFLSTDDTCKTATPGIDHDQTIGERIMDDKTLNPYDMVEEMEALDKQIREMPDPVMRLVMSSVLMADPEKSGFNKRIRVAIAKRRCAEEFGIDNDLFEDTFRRGEKVFAFFRKRDLETA